MGMTPEERKESQRAWWKANHEKAVAYRKAWRKKNPAKAKALDKRRRKKYAVRIRAYNKAYYYRNHEAMMRLKKKYREADPEKHRRHTRESHRKHPEIGINAKAKRRHQAGDDKLSAGLTERLVKEQRGRCAICGKALGKERPHRDHRIPLSKGGRNVDGNIQITHRRCNQVKGAKMPA